MLLGLGTIRIPLMKGAGYPAPLAPQEKDTSSALLFRHAVIVELIRQHRCLGFGRSRERRRRLVASCRCAGEVDDHAAGRRPHGDLLLLLVICRVENGNGVIRAVGYHDVFRFTGSLSQDIEAMATGYHKRDFPQEGQRRGRCGQSR